MTVREGALTPRPATLWETPWSEGSVKYIRNVEAEGSNPFTSTGALVRGLKVDFLQLQEVPMSVTLALQKSRVRSEAKNLKAQFTGGNWDALSFEYPLWLDDG